MCVWSIYIYMREHARARPGKPDFQSTNQKQLKNCKYIYTYPEVDGLGAGLGIHKSGKLASHGEQVYVWVGDGVGDGKRGVGLRKKGNEEKGKKKN